jgi:hypothetical protein
MFCSCAEPLATDRHVSWFARRARLEERGAPVSLVRVAFQCLVQLAYSSGDSGFVLSIPISRSKQR